MLKTGPFGGPEVFAIQRLSSNSHWVLPITHPTLGQFHVLTYHATPPLFDGSEGRNRRRNHDETAFWTLYLNNSFGPAPPDRFVLMGDANIDPARGKGQPEAIQALLNDPRLQDPLPDKTTVLWQNAGAMRVDYVLPSADWTVTDAKVLPAHPDASRHHLVWVDLTR